MGWGLIGSNTVLIMCAQIHFSSKSEILSLASMISLSMIMFVRKPLCRVMYEAKYL